MNVCMCDVFPSSIQTTSITGNQSTCFRHEARQAVAEAVNAKVGVLLIYGLFLSVIMFKHQHH